jgi:hypothetical protein
MRVVAWEFNSLDALLRDVREDTHAATVSEEEESSRAVWVTSASNRSSLVESFEVYSLLVNSHCEP